MEKGTNTIKINLYDYQERGVRPVKADAGRSRQSVLSVFLHELQHGLQDRESFAEGGSTLTSEKWLRTDAGRSSRFYPKYADVEGRIREHTFRKVRTGEYGDTYDPTAAALSKERERILLEVYHAIVRKKQVRATADRKEILVAFEKKGINASGNLDLGGYQEKTKVLVINLYQHQIAQDNGNYSLRAAERRRYTPLSILLHEIQHFVQVRDALSGGRNANETEKWLNTDAGRNSRFYTSYADIKGKIRAYHLAGISNPDYDSDSDPNVRVLSVEKNIILLEIYHALADKKQARANADMANLSKDIEKSFMTHLIYGQGMAQP